MAVTRSLKAGLVLLTVWCGLECLVAGWVTVATLSGQTPPALALVLSEDKIRRLDPQAQAVINAQAAIVNPCIIGLCVFVLVLGWKSMAAGARWSFWLIFGVLLPLQGFAFAGDAFLGHRNLAGNLVSTALVLGSLALCGLGLRARWEATT